MKYAALFVRDDSEYKNRDCDAYDKSRDATSYEGDLPVVAHPPCRAWGMLAHMSFRSLPMEERELALFSIDMVRRNGGIIEHPAGSKLFKGGHGATLPDVGGFADEWGGFTILVDQFDFGHVASKPTKLYICGGVAPLPQLPDRRTDLPTKVIDRDKTGLGRPTCRIGEREHTPTALIDWIEKVLTKIGEQ